MLTTYAAKVQCLKSSFLTKQKPEGVGLLWQWLQDERVVGLFLARPCGSASRARQIPMSNQRKFHGPKPLRTDSHPNGRLHLSFKDRQRVSLASKLYGLTSRLVEWAVANGCTTCVENPEFSLFWATTYWTSVAHLVSYAVFHSCQYGSACQKTTMIAFSHRDMRS